MSSRASQLFLWSGTLNGHGAEAQRDIEEWLAKHCKRYAYQLERGEEKGNLHWQLAINLRTRARVTEITKLTKDTIMHGTHWTASSGDGDAAARYAMKAETRVAGPFGTEIAAQPKELIGLKLRTWQEQIAEDMQRPCTPTQRRQINVLIDPLGGLGKSLLVKYLRWNKLAVAIPPVPKGEDLMGMVMCQPISNGYVIDIPRAEEDKKLSGMWTAVECIKGGYAYDKRFKFRSATFTNPKVWVMCNWCPNKAHLSTDRWKWWLVYNDILVDYTDARLARVIELGEAKMSEEEESKEPVKIAHIAGLDD